MKLTVKNFESLNSALRFGTKKVLKLLEHINEIESEKAALLQQIEIEAEEQQKPVVIPLEVADAIEYFRFCSFSNADFVRVLFKPVSLMDNKNTQIIKKFIYDESHGDVLMEALVNGYTVETLESKIKSGVEKIYHEWATAALDNQWDMATEQEEMSKRITDFVTQIIREDQASHG